MDDGLARQVAAKIRELRVSAGLTQKQIGEQIGVTGARVSQLESESAPMPPDDVLLKLAAILGDDVLRAARWGPHGRDRSYRDDAVAAIWKTRIEVLSDRYVVTSSSEARQRARLLASELEAVACRASEAAVHVRNGRLDSLARITADMPDGVLMIVAVEAMGMQMDAPLHVLTPSDRGRARKAVADIFGDIRRRLDFDQARRVLESGPRELWRWEDLSCAGGALGQLHALCSGDPSVLLLKGNEPAGWMGWPMMAGMWQVRPAQVEVGSDGNRSADAVARLGGNLAGSDRLWVPPVQRVPMAEAALNRLSRGGRLQEGGQPQDGEGGQPSLEWLGNADADIRHQVLTARALGRHWVRQHANRLVAVCRAIPEGDPESDLPTLADARSSIQRLEQAAQDLKLREEAASGTWKQDEDEVLREWVDLQNTWTRTAGKLA